MGNQSSNRDDERWSRIRRFLQGVFVEDVLVESIENHQDRIPFLQFVRECYCDLGFCMLNAYATPDKSILNNLVYIRLFDWERTVYWSTLAVYAGAYESMVRELRFLLEDVVQSMYFEMKMGNVDPAAKIRAHAILDDFRLRGSRVIDNVLSGELRTESNKHYSRLSEYVHPTLKRVESSLSRDDCAMGYEYDEELFNESFELFKETHDLIFALIISNYPKITDLLVRCDVYSQLGNYGLKKTLRICNQIQKRSSK